ncbi:hypothetical protein PG993_004156 [Apiospora rasikravindrae]|uniref:Uncharacterized protein n=1 Tax=Apiospora rasikravindrae TaxID=990691 RepID=A0ABR1TBZ1_9PEZI
MDVSMLSEEQMTTLSYYQCGFVRPNTDNPAQFPVADSLVLSQRELAHYDTPDTDYLDHHPAASFILAQWGGRDITAVFNDAHNHALTAATTGPAKTVVRQVGRLVPAQSALGADQVALGVYAFALDDLSVAAARRTVAVGKYEPAQPTPAAQFSMEQLRAHEARALLRPDGGGAWIAIPEGQRMAVYDITGLIRHPSFFDFPCIAEAWTIEAGKIIGAGEMADWLQANLGHRRLGLMG